MEPVEAHTLDASEGRRSMGAFLVSGMLVSFLGAILPAWRYHLRDDFREVGYYFLSLNLGFLLSAGVTHSCCRAGREISFDSGSGVSLRRISLPGVELAPVPAFWRLLAVLGIGVSAGLTECGTLSDDFSTVPATIGQPRSTSRAQCSDLDA